MSIFCLFGHKWGHPYNIREGDVGAAILFVPILFFYNYFGYPKVCDIKCKRCGKVKTISYGN